MKHLIIVKFKENIWNREDAASREMLADIKKIFNRTKQIEGVHTVNIYENVTPRPNRHDLMIEMEMDRGGAACVRCFCDPSGMEGKVREVYSD